MSNIKNLCPTDFTLNKLDNELLCMAMICALPDHLVIQGEEVVIEVAELVVVTTMGSERSLHASYVEKKSIWWQDVQKTRLLHLVPIRQRRERRQRLLKRQEMQVMFIMHLQLLLC
jgi:hypothetical protein